LREGLLAFVDVVGHFTLLKLVECGSRSGFEFHDLWLSKTF